MSTSHTARSKPSSDQPSHRREEVQWPLVKVIWEDSRTPYDGWTMASDTQQDLFLECVSVGYLVHDSVSQIVLAPHIAIWCEDDPETCGVMVIPQRAILDVIDLEEAIVKG